MKPEDKSELKYQATCLLLIPDINFAVLFPYLACTSNLDEYSSLPLKIPNDFHVFFIYFLMLFAC